MLEEFSSTFLSSLVNHQISGNQKHHRFRISHSSINTMAEWSQLPKDLLEEISGHLDTSIDLLRFRSICTSWRSSSLSHKRQYFPGSFRILPNDGIAHTSSLGFHLSTRTILLISPLCDPALDEAEEVGRCSSWLIKVEEHGCGVERKRRLLHPLTRSRYPLSASSKFPLRLDFSNYRVRELGQEYVLHHVNFKSNASSLMDNNNDAENLYMEKVVSIFLNGEGDFVLLTIHVSGKLAMFKSGEKRWTIIPDMPSPYDDVIVYKGKFFAVDNTGRTVVVGLDRELGVVANPVFGGDKKYLVKSRDGLLLVDMYLSIDTGEGALSFDEGFLEHLAHYMSERTVRFKVFKLDEEGKNWIEMESLGDRVLFLGDDSSFCVSSSDLSGCKGNQIIFGDNFSFMREPSSDGEDGVLTGHDMGVFELETGCIGPLGNYPGHSKLFWPPPQWVISTSSEVQNQTQTEAPSQ